MIYTEPTEADIGTTYAECLGFDIAQLWNYSKFHASSGVVVFYDDVDNRIVLKGQRFVFDTTGVPMAGKVTTFIVRSEGQVIASVSGASAPLPRLYALARECSTEKFLALLCAGQTEIRGAAFLAGTKAWRPQPMLTMQASDTTPPPPPPPAPPRLSSMPAPAATLVEKPVPESVTPKLHLKLVQPLPKIDLHLHTAPSPAARQVVAPLIQPLTIRTSQPAPIMPAQTRNPVASSFAKPVSPQPKPPSFIASPLKLDMPQSPVPAPIEVRPYPNFEDLLNGSLKPEPVSSPQVNPQTENPPLTNAELDAAFVDAVRKSRLVSQIPNDKAQAFYRRFNNTNWKTGLGRVAQN
jgi:hypothetical protein